MMKYLYVIALVLCSCTMYDTFDEELLPSAMSKDDAVDDSQSSSSDVAKSSSGTQVQESSSSVAVESSSSSEAGPEESSSSVVLLDSFEDPRDKQVYKIVAIGTHQWFARNLNYNAGDGQSFCYDDDAANCEKYGRLYKGNSSAFINNLCPKGTHVSSRQDWEVLFKRFKGSSGDSVAVFLKDTTGWDNYEGVQYGANDESGLGMLPGGFWSEGEFKLLGQFGLWWTSTMPDLDFPYEYTTFQLGYSSDDVSMFGHEFKENALSVRCVVNE